MNQHNILLQRWHIATWNTVIIALLFHLPLCTGSFFVSQPQPPNPTPPLAVLWTVKVVLINPMSSNLSFTNPVLHSYKHMWETADIERPSSLHSWIFFTIRHLRSFCSRNRILCCQQRPDSDCSVTSKGIVVFKLIELNAIFYVLWREWKSTRKRKRHAREEKRLKKQRERGKKEVKLMFGQMKKDGWELMAWAKEAEEAA